MSEKLLKINTQLYSNEEVNTGKYFNDFPVYRKMISNIRLYPGFNEFEHGINKLSFIVSASGSCLLMNSDCIVFPESCCDDVASYGISIRNITKTKFGILVGTGYTGVQAINFAHIIFEYVKTS